MSRSSGYADDVIGHCESEAQAQQLLAALVVRLSTCKLELHPQKTKIVYCKDANRRGDYPESSLTFWGLRFDPEKRKLVMGSILCYFRRQSAERRRPGCGRRCGAEREARGASAAAWVAGQDEHVPDGLPGAGTGE